MLKKTKNYSMCLYMLKVRQLPISSQIRGGRYTNVIVITGIIVFHDMDCAIPSSVG